MRATPARKPDILRLRYGSSPLKLAPNRNPRDLYSSVDLAGAKGLSSVIGGAWCGLGPLRDRSNPLIVNEPEAASSNHVPAFHESIQGRQQNGPGNRHEQPHRLAGSMQTRYSSDDAGQQGAGHATEHGHENPRPDLVQV